MQHTHSNSPSIKSPAADNERARKLSSTESLTLTSDPDLQSHESYCQD